MNNVLPRHKYTFRSDRWNDVGVERWMYPMMYPRYVFVYYVLSPRRPKTVTTGDSRVQR